ncbi:MAG: hypothetical protein ACPG49_05015 [Chitinophagales bacterium]
MKMSLYTRLFLLSFILVLSTAIELFACGPMEDPYEDRVSFFNSDILNDTTYRIAYWDAERYSQNSWNQTLAERHAYNVGDWYKYFEETPNKEDIAEVVYKSDTLLLQELYRQIAYGKPYKMTDDKWKNNELLKYLYTKKDIDAINYLIIAKKCEPFVIYDPWSETEQNPDETKKLIDYILIKHHNCRTNFIKLRYAYQAVRLALYTGRYQEAIDIYTKKATRIIGSSQQGRGLIGESIIRYWIMALRAGAHKRLGDHAPAMYGFARVFVESQDKKQLALQNFEYTNEEDWEQTLKIAARIPGIATTLWMMRGLKNQELDLEALRNMYADQPSSELVELMMVREINKIEELLLSPNVTQAVNIEDGIEGTEKASITTQTKFSKASILDSIQNFFKNIWQTIISWFSSENSDDAEINTFVLNPQVENPTYIREFKAFVDSARLSASLNSPTLWDTASAYLSYLLQDYGEANKILNQLVNMQVTAKVQQQAMLVYSLNNLAINKKMNAGLENSFYESLKNLSKPKQAYENFNVYSRSMMHIAQHYLLQGDIPKAILCFNSAKDLDATRILADFHATQSDLQRLRQLAINPNKNSFEEHLFEDGLFTEDLILDLMGTKLMREQKYEAALKKYQQINSEYWQESEGNKTWGGLTYNTIPCDFEHNALSKNPITKRCNKMQFAQRVINLLQSSKENPAESYFKLGNGFSNTPFWGYTGNLWQGDLIWTLREYGQPVSGEYGVGTYPFNIPSLTEVLQRSINHFTADYGTRNHSVNYYQLVLEKTNKDQKELGAKAAYLAMFCQKNPLASIQSGNHTDSTYARILVQQYGDTDFFGEVIEECPDLKAYQ